MSDKGALVATASSYSASGGVVLFGAWTANELAAIAGVVLGFATFVVNWYYRHKHLQLAREAQEGEGGSHDAG